MIRVIVLGLAAAALSTPAFADTVVYACKIERRIEGQDQQIYSPTLRADPTFAFRFAMDETAGKACRLDGMTCMPMFSVLSLSRVDGTIKAVGTRFTDGLPTTLTAWPTGRMSFVVAGVVNGRSVNSQTLSSEGDCVATGEKAAIR